MRISYKQDFAYANDRLAGTIVSKDGRPIHLQAVSRNGSVSFNFLGSDEVSVCKLEEVDVTPIKLGYINLPIRAEYFFRIPSRQYKQGLREGTCANQAGRRSNITHSRQLVNCMLGIYPSVDQCVETLVNGESQSVAFGRKYAVAAKGGGTGGFGLLYKDKVVGGINGISLVAKLSKDYEFLTEDLIGVMK